MNDFSNADGRRLVEHMIATIRQNAALLSNLDGVIGDGDHGVNMDKGFTLCAERLAGTDWNLSRGLSVLSDVLLEEIGGAMGPLYGSFFGALAAASDGQARIDTAVCSVMLNAGLTAVTRLGGASVGDKTLVDTLAPAVESFDATVALGGSLAQAWSELALAAEKGKDSTKDLVARVGRASRLGERSRGMLDAGAVSCWLLLRSMAHASQSLL